MPLNSLGRFSGGHGAGKIRKYNPGFLTDDQLVQQFCVRGTELDLLLNFLRDCDGPSNPPQVPPQIVIGPRGSGKTSLLLRIMVEVRRDAILSSHFLPVVFAEESYGVSTVGEFWFECLSQLADQTPNGSSQSALVEAIRELRDVRDDRELANRSLGAALDFAVREEKRLLLVVENLNMLFGDMVDPDAGSRLRKVLQNEPQVVLFGSATSRFDEIDNPENALYDLFRVCTLRPLTTQECATLWETISGRPANSGTARSLEILTGGSPRLLTILARFGSATSFSALVMDLLDLVDEHTEYFKSHIESLPAQERKIYLALAELWKPATTREIATRSRTDTNACSAHLARLTERGFVQVAGGSPRKRQYYVTERLYNIYYLLRRRRGSDPLVEALVRFMDAFYSPRELMDITRQIRLDEETCDRESVVLHRAAFSRLVNLPKLAPYRATLYAGIPAEIANGLNLWPLSGDSVGLGDTILASATDSDVQSNGKKREPAELTALCERLHAAAAGGTDEEFEEAISQYSTACRESDVEYGASGAIAHALIHRGIARGSNGMAEEAAVLLERAVELLGEPDNGVSRDMVVNALMNKGVALSELNLPERAVEALDDVIRHVGKMEHPVSNEPLAVALVRKGTLLEEMDRLDEAVAIWSDVVRRFGEDAMLAVKDAVAMALLSKASLLDDAGRDEEALNAYKDVVNRFGTRSELSLRESVGIALINTVRLHGKLRSREEQIAACDEVIDRFWNASDSELRHVTLMALVRKGVALSQLDRTAAAIAIWDEAVSRFEASDDEAIQDEIAHALYHKAIALARLDRGEDALAVCSEMLRHVGDPGDGEMLESLAVALVTKASILLDIGQPEESMVVSEEAVSRLTESEDPAVLRFVGRALINKGMALRTLDRTSEELSVWNDVARRFGDAEDSELQEHVGRSLLLKGRALDKMNRRDDGLIARREIVARYSGSERSNLQGLVQVALGEIADREMARGQYAEAVDAANQLLERTGSVSDDNRWQAHSVRAAAKLAGGNVPECERDIGMVLEILPELDELPSHAIRDLISLSLDIGIERMSELIQESPSNVLLMPLTTALEQELGRRPRVAQEVEEVARDIRRKLAQIRESRRRT